jgi:hypothetical protein
MPIRGGRSDGAMYFYGRADYRLCDFVDFHLSILSVTDFENIFNSLWVLGLGGISQNRKEHEKQLVAAAKTGEAQILTTERLMERIAASRKTPSPVVALRIPQSDLALARKQAE